MRLGFGVFALASVIASPVSARTLNWESYPDRIKYVHAFGWIADACVEEFGFTRAPKLTDDEAQRKLYAFMLVQPSAGSKAYEWDQKAEEFADKGEASAQRGGDAIAAAAMDPSQTEAARKIYYSEMNAFMAKKLQTCRYFAHDGFIGPNYLLGEGTDALYLAQFEGAFERSVANATKPNK